MRGADDCVHLIGHSSDKPDAHAERCVVIVG